MPPEKSFTQWVKQQRKSLDLTQLDLAERIGCSSKTIEKIESGERRPSKQLVELLAQSLNIPEEQYVEFVQLARSVPTQLPVERENGVRSSQAGHGESQPEDSKDPQIPILPSREMPPHNLPAQLNSFVGRSKEISNAYSLLKQSQARLLVFAGPPGVGKTRLALQVASTLLPHFGNGVYFVPVEFITQPDLVISLIAKALGVREKAQQPLLDTLKEYLRAKHMLLVLDNFEQVADAAPLLVELLAGAVHLKILITTRHVLHVYGEYDLHILPLSMPTWTSSEGTGEVAGQLELHDTQWLFKFEAVRLFVERAEAASPGFESVSANLLLAARICRLLDGMPLAIELAASRVKFMTMGQLLDQLHTGLLSLSTRTHGGSDRQRTLRGTLVWSYNLLNVQEQELLCRLSLFGRGVTRDVIRSVFCTGNYESGQTLLHEEDLFATVEALLDKNLLQQKLGPSGVIVYSMLEAIREFAYEQLEISGKAESVGQIVASYHVHLAEQAESGLKGPEQSSWLARLEIEHDNIRDTLTRLQRRVGAGDIEAIEIAQRIAGALVLFWLIRGYWSEGRHWLTQILALHGINEDTPWRAKSLLGAGFLAWEQGDYTNAWSLYKQSLQIYSKLGDKRGMAETLRKLGLAATLKGDYQAARDLYTEGLNLYRELGDKQGISSLLYSMGKVTRFQGEYALSRQSYTESLHIFRELGDLRQASYSLIGLAAMALEEGDYAEAKDLFGQSLGIAQELNDAHGTVSALTGLGEVARCMGDFQAAFQHNEFSLTILRKLGDKWRIITSLHNLGHIACKRGDYEQSYDLFLESLQLSQEVGDRQHVGYCLAGLSSIAALQGRFETSARLMGASEVRLEEIGAHLQAADRAEYEQIKQMCCEELGQTIFTALVTAGRSMTLEQAMAELGDAGSKLNTRDCVLGI